MTTLNGTELYAPWKPCAVCGRSSKRYFDGNVNIPLCDGNGCEDKLIADINFEIITAAAEAAEE